MTTTAVTTTQTEITPAEQQRLESWKSFGIMYSATLQNLQLNCSAIASRLDTLPSDVILITQYEDTLAGAKRELNELEENKRKPFTSKIDALIGRCMQPHKDALLKVTAYSNALLVVKKEAAEIDRKAKAKITEAASIREYFANHITSIHSQIEQAIIAAITKIFEYALSAKSQTDASPNIDEVGLEAYLKQIAESKKYAKAVWVTAKPKIIANPAYHSVEEVDAMWDAIHAEKSTLPAAYRKSFLDQLSTRFEFYNISLINREASLKLALQEQSEAVATSQSEASNAAIANKLETVASAPTTTVGGRKLKSVYKLELENNPANLRLLLTVLVANADILLPLIKTKTFFETICNVVVAHKNKDENFECAGVKFIVEEKL